MKTHSEEFNRKRKFFMVLPLLVTPFITMLFWALGGGKGTVAAPGKPTGELNAALPEAYFGKKEIWDKLSLYDIAARDSAKFEEARRRDPYFDLMTFQNEYDHEKGQHETDSNNLVSRFPDKQKEIKHDANEEKVNRKLDQLYREINKGTFENNTAERKQPIPHSDPRFSEDVDRLESMMEMMNADPQTDPEMRQIEGLLEKILDIQHPDRVKEKLDALYKQRKTTALNVQTAKDIDNISLLGTSTSESSRELDTTNFLGIRTWSRSANAFYGLDENTAVDDSIANAIPAVIHDNQELIDRATVKLRLSEDVDIGGRAIRRGQFVFGTCTINGERLKIEVNSIRNGDSILPVSLTAYDMDGQEGLFIPGALSRDAAKQAPGNALQNIQLMSLDPSLGAQAAAVGVEAAKGLIGKKAKLIKVTVKAGYHVLLKNDSSGSH